MKFISRIVSDCRFPAARSDSQVHTSFLA